MRSLRPTRHRLFLLLICALTLALIFYTTRFGDETAKTKNAKKIDLDLDPNGVNINRMVDRTQEEESDSDLASGVDVEGDEGPCELPRLDPFDPAILEYVELQNDQMDCSTKKYGRPILFSTDNESNLIRLVEPTKYGLRDCCYKGLQLVDEERVMVRISPTCYPILDKVTPISPRYEFIIVYCSDRDRGLFGRLGWTSKTLVIDMFNFVHEKSVPPPDLELKTPKDSLNVVLIGLGAMSHMNFIRTMPSTYNYLQNVSAIGLNGYTKVGTTTASNLSPLLTGLSAKEMEANVDCWAGGYFGNCSFIWRRFSDAGYVTSFSEDTDGKSHQTKPTDYFLPPFMTTLALEATLYTRQPGEGQCLGSQLWLKAVLDHIAKLDVTMTRLRHSVDQKYFAFSWFNNLPHPNQTDQTLAEFLQAFQGLQHSKKEAKTILVLLSDHGMRGGDIRSTVQGRIEERMPFAYFMFPDWFKVKYSVAIQNLKTNSERLITAFDIHETLRDLVDPAKSISNEALRDHRHNDSGLVPLPRGISLFASVPPSRTCADAAIDPYSCVCLSKQNILSPANNQRVKNAAKVIVSSLNGLLAEYSHARCAQLRLADILAAQQFVEPRLLRLDDEETANCANTRLTSKLTVTFNVEPSQGLFEAAVVQEKSGHFVLDGEVKRLNRVGNQSSCVDNYKLKKYCYCL